MFRLELTIHQFEPPFRGNVHFNWDGEMGGTAGHILFYGAKSIWQYGDEIYVNEPNYSGDLPEGAVGYVERMFDDSFKIYFENTTGVSFCSNANIYDEIKTHTGYQISKKNTRQSLKKLLILDIIKK